VTEFEQVHRDCPAHILWRPLSIRISSARGFVDCQLACRFARQCGGGQKSVLPRPNPAGAPAHFVEIRQVDARDLPHIVRETGPWASRAVADVRNDAGQARGSAMKDTALSIIQGTPLSDEPGLGALTLPGFIRDVTQRHADREALCDRGADGAILRWSYRELWDHSLSIAKALIACGLAKGERVGVLMTNRAEFLSAAFGTALAGGVFVPLSTFSTPHELEHLLSASACSFLLFERHVLKRDFVRILGELDPALATGPPGHAQSNGFPFLRHLAVLDGGALDGACESWDHFLARGEGVSTERVNACANTVCPADPGALFFSSGSTSKPKGILSANRGVAIQMWRMARQQALQDGVRSWAANGFFWSGNFAMVIGATLASGGALALQRIFQPEEALALMEAERVSFAFAWPHQWAQLEAARNWDRVDLSSLRHIDVHCPLARHPSVQTDWLEPRHSYGNTETFTLSTGFPANTSPATAGGSHGRPLPGNSVKIVDPLSGVVLPVGRRGEIAVRGPTLMLGYLSQPLDETLDDTGYFRTGDGGYVDGEGRLFWEGRLNDIIKTGGANVSPVEIDGVIKACPGVKVTQTVGVPHDMLGELVVACIVTHAGASLDEAVVRDFVKVKLASYKVPRRVLFFGEDELTLTGNAKVKTADLRALAVRRLAAEDADTVRSPAPGKD
jgi:acyl-CoA synthetase (AMP-forming)/AMP-acid ligase II